MNAVILSDKSLSSNFQIVTLSLPMSMGKTSVVCDVRACVACIKWADAIVCARILGYVVCARVCHTRAKQRQSKINETAK